MDKDYEVVKPFTILVLWESFDEEHSCPEFQENWGEFIRECLADWCDILGLKYERIQNRLGKLKWGVTEAFETPKLYRKRK